MYSKISKVVIPRDRNQRKIRFLRDQKVIQSSDFALWHSVPVKALVQAVKRNEWRFPEDFLFQLNLKELKDLKSQIVTSSWGGARRRSLNRAWLGSRAFCAVTASCRSISPSCVRSSNREACWPHTRSCGEKSRKWNANTTPDFKRFSPQLSRCWRLPCQLEERADSSRCLIPKGAGSDSGIML
jgi:hypothetical protein